MAVLKNIILDWSGTLADDLDAVLAATNVIFENYGKPPFSREAFREKFSLPFTEFYNRELPEADLNEAGPLFHNHLTAEQHLIKLLPGALEFLEFCRREGMPLFLLTAVPDGNLEIQARQTGVWDFFGGIYADTHDKRRTILQLLSEQELNAHETVFVGDMVHDLEAANQAGVVSCGVLTGYDPVEKLKRANPELLFHDLDGLRLYLGLHRDEPNYQPVATVGALIGNGQGCYLMFKTHKWSDKWGIPGGKIKADEPSVHALRREVMEETNLEITDIRFEMAQDCIRSDEYYKRAHFLLLNYTATAVPGREIALNDEAQEYRWVTLDHACELDLNNPTRILIKHVKERLAHAS